MRPVGLWASAGVSEWVRVAWVLRTARGLVAGGWAPTFSRDAQGKLVPGHSEGALLYCLVDALEVAAQWDVDAVVAAEELLSECLTPPWCQTLQDWEGVEGRTAAQVVRLLDVGIRRASAAARSS